MGEDLDYHPDELNQLRIIVLKTGRRFTCGTTSFECMAGKIVFSAATRQAKPKGAAGFWRSTR